MSTIINLRLKVKTGSLANSAMFNKNIILNRNTTMMFDDMTNAPMTDATEETTEETMPAEEMAPEAAEEAPAEEAPEVAPEA